MRLILAPSSLSYQPSLLSVCPYVKWSRAASSALPHCSVCWRVLDCRCKACLPTTGGPGKAALISSPPWLIKAFSCSSTSTFRCSYCIDHSQALIYSFIAAQLHSLTTQWMPLSFPAPPGASILPNVHQSVAVGGAPGHKVLLPVGRLPCGGSDHSVNNTWPGPAAHSDRGYIPGSTLMNN